MNRNDGESIRAESSSLRTARASGVGTGIVNSVDQMVKLPLQVTGATWDFMMRGMRNMTGTGQQERTAESNAIPSVAKPSAWPSPASDDLSGEDLKYVTWSLIFTKPGYECVLEPPHSELVSYDADVPSFAAVKIAKFLDKARHGHAEKAESWRDQNYPPSSRGGTRGESRTDISMSDTSTSVSSTSSSANSKSANSNAHERGWRVPADDQKHIMFLHRVEWRLPKQEEAARVERVTIERGTTRIA